MASLDINTVLYGVQSASMAAEVIVLIYWRASGRLEGRAHLAFRNSIRIPLMVATGCNLARSALNGNWIYQLLFVAFTVSCLVILIFDSDKTHADIQPS
ncbi:MAG: hypothetical protein C0500_04390 [Sphingobium sp.]|nr:hypothetical protein [Sphingobium sp.]